MRRCAAEVLCDEAPARFRDLVELGVRFDADRHGNLALGLEGGHSRPPRRARRRQRDRPAHPAPALGARRRGARASRSSRAAARRALLDRRRPLHRRRASTTADAARPRAWSSPPAAPPRCGRARPTRRARAAPGLLLARAAGAALADLEFVQFHPTAVAGVPGREGFLVTEAVRGEGATLHGADGERFVDELAPRDAVARAIFRTLRETGAPAVGLDMRDVDPARFPNVVAALREAGLDPATRARPGRAREPLRDGRRSSPTSTAARRVPGLYAVGECACTGLHGANRLASNSLSECFVFGRRAALAALDEPARRAPTPARRRTTRRAAPDPRDARGDVAARRPRARRRRACARCSTTRTRSRGSWPRCALPREESRGAHARADFPDTDPALDERHTLRRERLASARSLGSEGSP